MTWRISNQLGYTVDLDQLFRDALRALTGRADVELRFDDPPSRGAYGSLSRDMRGWLIVHISPMMTLDAIYEVFLHECAHVKLHSHLLPRSQAAEVKPGHLVNVQRESRQPDYMADEGEADRLRDTWREWATKNAWRVWDANWTLQGFDPVIYKLLIISKGWKP